MSIDRYARFLESAGVQFEQQKDWLYVPAEDVAIVISITPVMSPGYTTSLLRRVEDPWCRVLIDSMQTPFGQLHLNRLDTRINSYWVWVHDITNGAILRQIIPKT